MSLGLKFIDAILGENNVAGFINSGDMTHVFRPSEQEVYVFVRDFVRKHGAFPKKDTIFAHTGTDLSDSDEPSSYYLDILSKRHIEREIKRGLKEVGDKLGAENKDPEGALEILTRMVMDLQSTRHAGDLSDFRYAYESIVSAYVAEFTAEEGVGLLYGWPTLDKQTKGVGKGNLISEVGRPAMGKTWRMLYGAHYGWRRVAETIKAYESSSGSDQQVELPEGGSRLFVSMEMPILEITQRMAALHSRIPVENLDRADLGSESLTRLKNGLIEVKGYPNPFYILDGNLAATVEDIYMWARHLKPDAIFIDGGYLVKHPTERDRYRRVAENVELMKQELAPLAPTTVSWQFAKSASKKKSRDEVTGDDVGYSDAIFQASSVLLGLFEDESVETLDRRVTKILKGRKGQKGQFVTNWNFLTMDFSEIAEEDLGNLQYT